jgi:hypothetical protein
MPNA